MSFSSFHSSLLENLPHGRTTSIRWRAFWREGDFSGLVAVLYLKVRKQEGMGFGDIKMIAMVGAFLGWQYTWLTILLGSFLGAMVGSVCIYAFGRGRQYELPFGSFLGVGAIVSTLWGENLLRLYLG